MSSSLDAFFSKKDKIKKKKGFITFSEDVCKKQKENDQKTKFFTEDQCSINDSGLDSEKTPTTTFHNADDDWNEILEKSMLSDVFPDTQIEIDNELDDNVQDFNEDDELLDKDSKIIMNLEPSIPVSYILGENENQQSCKRVDIKLETDPDDQIIEAPKTIMLQETKKMTRFGAVVERPKESVKLDNPEDFPEISIGAVMDEKKIKQKEVFEKSNILTSLSKTNSRFFNSNTTAAIKDKNSSNTAETGPSPIKPTKSRFQPAAAVPPTSNLPLDESSEKIVEPVRKSKFFNSSAKTADVTTIANVPSPSLIESSSHSVPSKLPNNSTTEDVDKSVSTPLKFSSGFFSSKSVDSATNNSFKLPSSSGLFSKSVEKKPMFTGGGSTHTSATFNSRPSNTSTTSTTTSTTPRFIKRS